MSRFSIALIRLATLALLGSAGTAAYAQQTIDQNKALAGNVTPGDAPGFPITISVPGSYKLMSNLNVPANVQGIYVSVPGVTLDLNGFTVSSTNSCSQSSPGADVTCSYVVPTQYGVTGRKVLLPSGTETGTGSQVTSSASGTRVRNGTVKGFGGTGIVFYGDTKLEDLRVEQNGYQGVAVVTGELIRVNARHNRLSGITVSQSAVARELKSSNNGGSGFSGGGKGGTALFDSVFVGNKGKGATATAVRGVVATGNTLGNFDPSSISLGGNLNGDTPY